MSIMDNIGNATKLLMKVHDAELKAEILTLLLAARGEALDLQERVGQLQEENATLKQRLEARDKAERLELESLYMATGAWWRRDEESFQTYCPGCWAKDELLIPLTRQYKVLYNTLDSAQHARPRFPKYTRAASMSRLPSNPHPCGRGSDGA